MVTPTLRDDVNRLHVEWPTGETAEFPYIWLRDNCATGFHPQTLEREFDLTSVPSDIRPLTLATSDDSLTLTWQALNGSPPHVSTFGLDWLYAHRPGQMMQDPAAVERKHWRGDLETQHIARASGPEVLADDGALLRWLIAAKTHGLSIVSGLTGPEDGMDVARRAGFLRETNFGVIFEVVSKPDPNNLAYTSHQLPLHSDLTNQEMPPGYQFLHCLANDATGGGSLLCDGFAVAEDLRREDPEAFEILATTLIPMRFQDDAYDIRRQDTVIRVSEDGTIQEIRFNAHLAGMFTMDADTMERYYPAYRKFMELSRSDRYVISLKLQAGEMMVFDNRRIMHGREAFDPTSGGRHLRGCYVDHGEVDSRIRVLSRK